MSFLVENWFFLLVLLACIGMHFFGHGHGHRHGDRQEHEGAHGSGGAPRHGRGSSDSGG